MHQFTKHPIENLWYETYNFGTRVRMLGNQEECVYFDSESGRLLAHIYHDGFDKYYPTVYVSVARAMRLTSEYPCYLLSLRPFPRVAVEFFRFREMDQARGFIAEVLELCDSPWMTAVDE